MYNERAFDTFVGNTGRSQEQFGHEGKNNCYIELIDGNRDKDGGARANGRVLDYGRDDRIAFGLTARRRS